MPIFLSSGPFRAGLLLGLVLLAACAAAPGVSPQAARKKLIATGWDSPRPADFAGFLGEFEKAPFDGTTVLPTRLTADHRTIDASYAFGNEPWLPGEFDQAIADLKAAKPTTATDNFLFLSANPGDIDWFDDAGWAVIVEHWRLLARVARQGGLKGIVYDSEPYTAAYRQFKYGSQSQHDRHSFAEYSAKARERGRAVMRAVAAEYPDITILAYRLLCDALPAARAKGDPAPVLDRDPYYGLVPGFVNGWLDVLPRTATIIDGNELSYSYNSEEEFNRSSFANKQEVVSLVDPKNRGKFARRWRVGQALYLDSYCNPSTSHWYIDPRGDTRTERLEANAVSALRASDEYVWVYGEKGLWWRSALNYKPWPLRLPDADGALRRAKDRVNGRKP